MRILDCYVLPEFGAVLIGAVSSERVETFAAGLLSSRERPITPTTFRHIAHVSAGYAHGDDDGFTPPPLTAGQVGAVAAAVEERYPVYGLVVLFLACTGLCAAELAGLEVGDLTLNP